MSERKTIRPSAAQCRFASPCVSGYDPRAVFGASQSRVAAPVDASAVQIDHGTFRSLRSESGAPPLPSVRTNATRFPSGDQRGEKSRALDGPSQSIGVESLEKIPIQE